MQSASSRQTRMRDQEAALFIVYESCGRADAARRRLYTGLDPHFFTGCGRLIFVRLFVVLKNIEFLKIFLN